jgi:hypothetical protein
MLATMKATSLSVIVAGALLAGAAAASVPTPAASAARQAAQRLGCADTFRPAPAPPLAISSGSCAIGGARVDIYAFTSTHARDRWKAQALNFSGHFTEPGTLLIFSSVQEPIDQAAEVYFR